MELTNVCRGCLAGDRRLEALDPYRALFELMAPTTLTEMPVNAQVCWECRAHLRRLKRFGERVRSAGRLLRHHWMQEQGGKQTLQTLTSHCESTLTFTTIAYLDVPHILNPETCPERKNENDLMKSEFFELQDQLKSLEVEIKSEPQFDLDDDEPLINHKAEDKIRKVKRKTKKNKTETRRIKLKSSKKVIENESELRKEDVDFPLSSDDQNDDAAMDGGIYDEIADAVTQQDSMGSEKEKRHVRRKAAVKRTKTVKADIVEIKKSLRKKSAAEPVPETERYRTVLVSEEELAAWRVADAKLERYTTMRLPHKCTTCLLPFRWQEQLEQHNLKKHHPSIGEFECDVCAARFARESDAATHRRLHLTRYECLHCEHASRDKKDIDKHYEVQHCEAKYKCTICGEAFKTFFQQRYHREAAHRPLWQCQHCDKSFRLRGGLYSHMRIHQELPKAECPVCSKVYKNKYALMYHLRVHEEATRPFYCSACDVHFKSKNQLRLHMTTSMKHVTPDKLKFSCEACGRRFITDKRREHHYDSVHLNKTEFSCTECSKAYANKQSLRSHVLRKHKQTTLPRDKICDICGKGFHNNVLLRNHMRTHTGERPFHCKLCPSTFSYSAALYTHNRLVHLKMKREKACKKKATPAAFPDKGQWVGEAYSY